MSNPFVPIETAALDWSQGLPSSIQYQDVYYAQQGGIEQSLYVFLEGNRIKERCLALPSQEESIFTVGETGFGTGLNFLLTWQLWEQHAPKRARLHYVSCDKHPLSLNDLTTCLAQWPQLKKYSDLLIQHYPILTPGYHSISFNEGQIQLTLMLGDAWDCFEQALICGESKLEAELRTAFVDAWYLDGFSPKRNDTMWSEPLIKVISMLSKPGTTLATYTAASKVKSLLKQYGFELVKTKGFGGKRHMISGRFAASTARLKLRITPWHYAPPLPKEKKAVIIGAGLAGCFMAYSLSKRGWDITLIDEHKALAEGASANQQAVLFPKLSAYKSPLTQLMLDGFLYAHQFYSALLDEEDLGELKGAFILAHNKREQATQNSVNDWLQTYPELGQLLSQDQASDVLGIPVENGGLFLPLSGWINSPALCRALIARSKVRVRTQCRVEELTERPNGWSVGGIDTPIVILCNGYQTAQFSQSKHLPIKPIRGQMTVIKATSGSRNLSIPLCGDGHVLPAIANKHHIGATYGLDNASLVMNDSDDEDNKAKLKQLSTQTQWSDEVIDHWAGVRATTPDYLPLVGPIARADLFVEQFASLATNSKRWIAQAGPYYPGLYVCAGFGSRGLTTIPLCAEWLATYLNNEWSCLPRSLIQSLAPARFLRKKIVRCNSSPQAESSL